MGLFWFSKTPINFLFYVNRSSDNHDTNDKFLQHYIRKISIMIPIFCKLIYNKGYFAQLSLWLPWRSIDLVLLWGWGKGYYFSPFIFLLIKQKHTCKLKISIATCFVPSLPEMHSPTRPNMSWEWLHNESDYHPKNCCCWTINSRNVPSQHKCVYHI